MQSTCVDLGAYEQAVGHRARGVGEVNLTCRVFGRWELKWSTKNSHMHMRRWDRDCWLLALADLHIVIQKFITISKLLSNFVFIWLPKCITVQKRLKWAVLSVQGYIRFGLSFLTMWPNISFTKTSLFKDVGYLFIYLFICLFIYLFILGISLFVSDISISRRIMFHKLSLL